MTTACQVIAEIGSNWLGDEALAFTHIDAAARGHADGVKFQLFRAWTLYNEPPPQLERFELSLDLLPRLRDRAHSHGMAFSVTPYSPALAESLRGLVDAVKISAYDLTYEALLVTVASLGVPVVLSTAMATVEEINLALLRLNRPPSQVTLLHGVACYPAPYESSNLARMQRLQALWPEHPVGLSDHSQGTTVAAMAIALGAVMVEKHFRVAQEDILRRSPDALHSATPAEFGEITAAVSSMQAVLGDGAFGPQPCELPLFHTCRRTNQQSKRTGASS